MGQDNYIVPKVKQPKGNAKMKVRELEVKPKVKQPKVKQPKVRDIKV